MSASQQHDDPAADGAARAAQLVAMTLSLAEGVARLHAERLAAKAADDERQAAALRSRHRVEAAATWLSDRAGPPPPPGQAAPPRQAAPPGQAAPSARDPYAQKPSNGPLGVRIVCGPGDLAAQAFPVPVPDAMATAPQAARDAVPARPALTAPRPQPRLTGRPGAVPSRGGGPR